jgi:hypothetical protein
MMNGRLHSIFYPFSVEESSDDYDDQLHHIYFRSQIEIKQRNYRDHRGCNTSSLERPHAASLAFFQTSQSQSNMV